MSIADTFQRRIAATCAVLGVLAGMVAASVISRVELANGAAPGQPLLLEDAAALASSLEQFRGQPDSDALREQIADAVLQHYQAAGWPVVDVSVERGASGGLTVQVLEGRFGDISVAGGSEWMRRAVYADWSRRQSQPLTTGGVAAGLAWLHRNPLHAATIGFAPGSAPATADATLTLQETRPVRLYAGWRDDGSPPLDRNRFFAGFEMADAFGIPSWLNLEVLTGADRDEFHGSRGMMRLFLPVHHELRLGGYWTHAESDAGIPGFDAVSMVEGWNVSLRWLVPLPAWRGWQCEMGGGADFFRLDSEQRAGTSGVSGRADALHIAAELHASRRSGASRSGLDAELAVSPGGITGAANDASHSALRHGALADYALVRAGGWMQRDLAGNWTATGRVSGQWASDPVLPTQQCSPAGATGVRGYPASSVLGDSGFWGGVELLTPLLPLAASLARFKVRAAAFVDAGYVHDAVTSDDMSLASAGAGLRMGWASSVVMALDYGWRLTEPGGRLHLALRFEF
jgi:hemolysin activation/secretion protein